MVPAVKSLLDILEAIRRTTTDQSEQSGVVQAILTIELNALDDMEITLKSVRNDLFHHKGPLYDSFDHSESLVSLREAASDAVRQAINHFIEARQAGVAASKLL